MWKLITMNIDNNKNGLKPDPQTINVKQNSFDTVNPEIAAKMSEAVAGIKKDQTVVVGMSGGVDSAISALLLRQQGLRVIGLFMKNWDDSRNGASGPCTAESDYADVVKVCEQLEIPYYTVEFIEEYFEQVFRPSLVEYERGATPNPDIWCNQKIKFKAFFERALELGADYIATGHYCRRMYNSKTDEYSLLKGSDPGKDQSYFLYTISSKILSKVLFPIGNLIKKEVRALALANNIPVHDKKDSTGICFIGERHFATFLSQYIKPKRGPFLTLSGEVVGEHQGQAFYTIGQRKGLGLGGPGEPWYVVKKDPQKNIVYVERGADHPALFSNSLWVGSLSWVNKQFSEQSEIKAFPYQCSAKVRYRQSDQNCKIVNAQKDRLLVEFEVPQRAVTIGQSIVFYQGEVCLGGGIISEI